MLNVMYTATNEPAQTTKQFEIRTAQGLARFLACTKCFRDGFYRNGRRRTHRTLGTDERFQVPNCRGSLQNSEGMSPKIWEISELQNVRQSKTNPFERVLSCAYLEKMLSVAQLSRTSLGCRRALFKFVFREDMGGPQVTEHRSNPIECRSFKTFFCGPKLSPNRAL